MRNNYLLNDRQSIAAGIHCRRHDSTQLSRMFVQNRNLLDNPQSLSATGMKLMWEKVGMSTALRQLDKAEAVDVDVRLSWRRADW